MAEIASIEFCKAESGEDADSRERRCASHAVELGKIAVSDARKLYVLQMVVVLAGAWGLAYGAVYSTKWVLAGRKS